MNKDKSETLYEKTMRQLKNNPIVVAILVIGAVAVGLSQGLDIFDKLKNAISPAKAQITEIHVSIQPYDVVQGYTGVPILSTPVIKNGNDFNEISDSIIAQITDALQLGQDANYQAILKIEGDLLHSDKPLNGDLIAVLSNPVLQQPNVRVHIEDLVKGDQLTSRFQDQAFFSPNCNCIHLELSAPTMGYKDSSLDIYQLQDGYSFDPNAHVITKSVDLAIVPVSILIMSPKGEGATEQDINVTQLRLDSALRQRIQGNSKIRLSPYTNLDELKAAVDEEIANLPIGTGKEAYIFQNRVDYVVIVSFVMK